MPRVRTLSTGLLAFALASLPVMVQAQTALTLPPCRAGGPPVTLVIRTDTTSGWTVNGAPVAVVADPGYANASPATWIGPAGGRAPGPMTYRVQFNTPSMHGQMSVSAQWMADNCGGLLTAGAGTGVSASSPPPAMRTSCVAPSVSGQDFRAFNRVLTANFAPADSNNPTASLTFTVLNEPNSKIGLAGIFTITAQCSCRT